jgi:hypothetical protein
MRKTILLTVLMVFLGGLRPAQAENTSVVKVTDGVKAGILVHANPKFVYQSIRNQRVDDPGDAKELSRVDDEIVVEETFCKLPVIGSAICTYKETYLPYSAVDYKLVSSNRFKSFEGSWTLRPENGGIDTFVQLSAFIDTGLNLPFARQITNFATMRDVKERLIFVKHTAERAAKLALTAPSG